ncbi:MAG: hypothetical protein J6V09_05495 [Clostridia bacterium]|nr:hypothetical protein [Clostridia bacterium]
MKKKNLVILLILPFLMSIFCTTAINTTYNMIDVDISFIDWDYNEVEAFRISDSAYQLRATGVNQRNYAVTGKDDLVWTVTNADGTDSPYAEIVKKGSSYYLRTISSGLVKITCSNKKGNVTRSMTAVVYDTAAILMYPTVPASQSNIDSKIYYGQYDHTYGNVANIDMTVKVLPAELGSTVIAEHSDNVEYDAETRRVKIIGDGPAFVTLRDRDGIAASATYSFDIVRDGVNVYTYEDLLNCTNRSQNGEIVVLRKNFESLENTYRLTSDGKPINTANGLLYKNENTECFGSYNPKTGDFSFASEVYSFKTTYNTTFIEQWNDFAKGKSEYSAITDKVIAGLHVQKDFYGNGYTLNLHNLTYPYAYIPGVGANGTTVRIPQLTDENLFRGPLNLYTLGDPNNMPLVSLYGQDNVGMYVHGDGVTVNDVNLKNCDFGDRMANLDTVGTVMEIDGDGITVKNSKISNGKNVVRSFSSHNLKLKNCLLSNSRNFLFLTGANEYVPVDEKAIATFHTLDGTAQRMAIESFVAIGGKGDEILNKFLSEYCESTEEKERMRAALKSIQSALDSVGRGLENKGSAVIEDTYFFRSGIASICLESLFNSTFLESGSPSLVSKEIFGALNTDGKSLVPFVASGVSGVSYPVSLEITGKTSFYDYKKPDTVELDGLIRENISEVASSIGLYDGQVTIDTVFPLRTILMQKATSLGNVYRDAESGEAYVNIPIAFYGGGLNLSTVKITLDRGEMVSGAVEVDLLDTYINMRNHDSNDIIALLRGLVLKTVPTVTGFEPFEFHFVKDGYLYGETPKIADLIENAKGE